MPMLYMFGENHNNLAEIKSINRRIKQIRPDYLLHEMLYTDIVLTQEERLQRIAECRDGGPHCNPKLNADIYHLGVEMNLPLVGIDLEIDPRLRLSLKQQFERREKHMVGMIEQYRLKGNIVVVVGDAHLRKEPTVQLGAPSPLYSLYSHVAYIERSPTAKYSPETSHPSWLL